MMRGGLITMEKVRVLKYDHTPPAQGRVTGG